MIGRTAPARPLVGVGLMLAAMAILPVIDVFAKKLGQAGMPILIVVWARALFGGLMIAALCPARPKARGPSDRRSPCGSSRARCCLFGATFLFFQALKHLPIADALAIFFVNPLVIVILSALALA